MAMKKIVRESKFMTRSFSVTNREFDFLWIRRNELEDESSFIINTGIVDELVFTEAV